MQKCDYCGRDLPDTPIVDGNDKFCDELCQKADIRERTRLDDDGCGSTKECA